MTRLVEKIRWGVNLRRIGGDIYFNPINQNGMDVMMEHYMNLKNKLIAFYVMETKEITSI